MSDKRFGGKAGEDYSLFRMACPHFDDLENLVGEIIKKEYIKSTLQEIKVFELGCGPGYTTTIILNADIRTKIFAIDNELVMIAQARNILEEFIKDGRVYLFEEDALDFLKKQPTNFFDVFASGFTLHNFNKDFRNEVLKEIYRVLKPNGIFINADKYALDNEVDHNKTLEWQLQQFKEVYSKINRPDLIEEWTYHYLEDNKDSVIMKEGVFIEKMKEIGLLDIEVIFRKKMEALVVAKK